ncbi:uncharacterized protein ISCGN_010163 [Ixodes scapularis]
MKDLPTKLQGIPNLHHSIYADDVTLWMVGGSDGAIQDSLQEAIRIVEAYAKERGLACCQEKSELLLMAGTTVKTPSGIILQVGGKDVPRVRRLRILGLWLQEDGKNTYSIGVLRNHAQQVGRLIARIAGKRYGMKERNVIRLIKAFVISRIAYIAPFLDLTLTERDAIDRIIRCEDISHPRMRKPLPAGVARPVSCGALLPVRKARGTCESRCLENGVSTDPEPRRGRLHLSSVTTDPSHVGHHTRTQGAPILVGAWYLSSADLIQGIALSFRVGISTASYAAFTELNGLLVGISQQPQGKTKTQKILSAMGTPLATNLVRMMSKSTDIHLPPFVLNPSRLYDLVTAFGAFPLDDVKCEGLEGFSCSPRFAGVPSEAEISESEHLFHQFLLTKRSPFQNTHQLEGNALNVEIVASQSAPLIGLDNYVRALRGDQHEQQEDPRRPPPGIGRGARVHPPNP